MAKLLSTPILRASPSSVKLLMVLPKKNSPETLKSEVNAATKQAESMCEKEKNALLQVRIIIKPTDDDGVKYLNKTLKNTQKSKNKNS